jgi:cyclopropane-fatty-acyl-phospholipid synthase
VHDERIYKRAVLGGSLAFGEAYLDGWFDAESMDGMFIRLMRGSGEGTNSGGVRSKMFVEKAGRKFQALHNALTNRQKVERAAEVAVTHYDAGNDLFEQMLDPLMMYSCGYWQGGAQTLAESQIAKVDLIARKLELQPGMKVLDIGCGWGGAAYHMAKTYGVSVIGVTISSEQVKLGEERFAGLDAQIRLEDYRSLTETFDAIYSIGMFEHVGAKNYATYFETAKRCLNPQGRFLLHTIGDHHAGPHLDP